MPDQNLPTPLTPSSRRALAAGMLAAATGTPQFACGLLVDALDLAAVALLAAAGADRAAAGHVLVTLFVPADDGSRTVNPREEALAARVDALTDWRREQAGTGEVASSVAWRPSRRSADG